MKKILVVWVFLSIVTLGCGRFSQPQTSTQNLTNLNPGNSGGGGAGGGGGGGGNSAPVFRVDQVVLNQFPLGSAPNRIAMAGDFAYIVNSISNNIERINVRTQTVTSPFAVLNNGSNPWDMAILGGFGFVTNYVANSVAVVDLSSGQIVTTIVAGANNDFNNPEGLAISDNGLIFVGNTEFNGGNVGPGFVTVINATTRTVVNKIPTHQKNPQFIFARGNTVYVVNSGQLGFDAGCQCFRPLTDGGVDIIDATTATTAVQPNFNIPIPLDPAFPLRGYPGGFGISPDGKKAYIGSNSGVLYKVDLENRLLMRGNTNPIFVTPNAADNLVNVKIDSKGIAWILSFNEDLAYILDQSTDLVQTPSISLNADVNLLEGPGDLAFFENGDFPDVYVIMSVSERLSAIITN